MQEILAFSTSCRQDFFTHFQHRPMRVSIVYDWVNFSFFSFIASQDTDNEFNITRTWNDVFVALALKGSSVQWTRFSKACCKYIPSFMLVKGMDLSLKRVRKTSLARLSFFLCIEGKATKFTSSENPGLCQALAAHYACWTGTCTASNLFCSARISTISAEPAQWMGRLAALVPIWEQIA